MAVFQYNPLHIFDQNAGVLELLHIWSDFPLFSGSTIFTCARFP